MTTAASANASVSIVPDDDRVALEQLASDIIGHASRLAAATCRWLLLIAAFDAREGYRHYVLSSTARWLSHYCSLSRRTAIEHVRVARALAAHPPLAAAMSSGRLSYSHVRAISRVSELGDTAFVASLINLAEHGTVRQLEDVVRGLRTVDDNERDMPATARERFTRRWCADSTWRCSARLDPEHGALVQSAVDAIADREGITQAEALTRMAEIALATVAGQTGELPSLRGDERAAVVVHLDASAVPQADEHEDVERSRERSSAAHRPYARVARGPGLPARVVERLLCQGRVRTVSFDADHYPIDVGRSRRLVSKKQLIALFLRDGGCALPGCGNRGGVEAHHVRHWLHGGSTSLDNLVLLCRRHHHALHDGDVRITALGRQQFRFLRKDGTDLPPHADLGSEPDAPPLESEYAELADDAITTRWDGSRLDHHYAVATLAHGLTAVSRQARPSNDVGRCGTAPPAARDDAFPTRAGAA